MPKVSVHGVKINYIEGESFRKERPTILMIHGAGQSTLTWKYQEDPLKDHTRFNLVTLDLPGHGYSEGSGYRRVKDYTEFIKNFVDALGLEKLILVGHSMGGAISQCFTLNHSDRVFACVLVGTGARLRVAKETLEGVQGDYRAFCEIAPTRSFAESSPMELKRKFIEELLKAPQEVVYWDLMACDVFDIMDRAKEIKVPTLVISATEDVLIPVKYGQYLHEKIQGSRFHIIENAGHFMMQEKPEEFNRVLVEFLDSLFLDKSLD